MELSLECWVMVGRDEDFFFGLCGKGMWDFKL